MRKRGRQCKVRNRLKHGPARARERVIQHARRQRNNTCPRDGHSAVAPTHRFYVKRGYQTARIAGRARCTHPNITSGKLAIRLPRSALNVQRTVRPGEDRQRCAANRTACGAAVSTRRHRPPQRAVDRPQQPRWVECGSNRCPGKQLSRGERPIWVHRELRAVDHLRRHTRGSARRQVHHKWTQRRGKRECQYRDPRCCQRGHTQPHTPTARQGAHHGRGSGTHNWK